MNIKKMLKQAQRMQAEMEEKINAMQVEGSAGGGAVKIVLSGKRDILSVHVDPEILSPDDAEMVEEMILAAFQDAADKIDAELEPMMQGMTAGLPI